MRDLPPDVLDAIKATAGDDLHRLHFTVGTEVRNALGLWTGNRELLDDVGTDQPRCGKR